MVSGWHVVCQTSKPIVDLTCLWPTLWSVTIRGELHTNRFTWSIPYLWLSKVLANNGRCYICNTISRWLRPYDTVSFRWLSHRQKTSSYLLSQSMVIATLKNGMYNTDRGMATGLLCIKPMSLFFPNTHNKSLVDRPSLRSLRYEE